MSANTAARSQKPPPRLFLQWLVMALGLALVPSAFVYAYGPRFALNWTDSMPRGFYWRAQPKERAIARGVTVIACVPQPYAQLAHRAGYLDAGACGGVSSVLKFVVAIAGDRVVLSSGGVFVNGARIEGSTPRAVDEHGRPVPHIAFGTYVLGRGQVWLASPKVRSFDSRYFGPVPIDNVVAIASPIFIVQ